MKKCRNLEKQIVWKNLLLLIMPLLIANFVRKRHRLEFILPFQKPYLNRVDIALKPNLDLTEKIGKAFIKQGKF